MTIRSAQKKVIEKLAHNRVVLLKALPRAGRTTLLRALIQDTSDGSALISGEECCSRQPQEIHRSFTGCTLFVDPIGTEQVPAIDALVRSCHELGPSAPRFVLVGRDTKTEQLLSGALTGIAIDAELPPVQILEHLNDSKPLITAQSPIQLGAQQAQATNLPVWSPEVLWLRGGLPESLFSYSDDHSFVWRKSYLDSVLKQDLSSWGVDASDRLPEVFQWIANNNGEQFDDANCAKNLSLKRESVRTSLNLLERMGLLRRLPNWPAGSNHSLNSMPVYYVRDCGLLHAMLGIDTIDKLRTGKSVGHSWESFSIEAIINAASESVTPAFYRDRNNNEIDLVLNFSSEIVYAIEFKVNEKARATKGFSVACCAIGATRKFVVHSGETDTTSEEGVSRLSLISAIRSLPR